MDEIDAALDFKNVSIVAFYIYVSTSLVELDNSSYQDNFSPRIDFLQLWLRYQIQQIFSVGSSIYEKFQNLRTLRLLFITN